MSLETRVKDALVSVATDYKQLRTWLTGSSSGSLDALATTNKSSIVAAINEVLANAGGGDVTQADLDALRDQLLGGVGPMADTLQELYTLAQDAEETAAINSLAILVGQKIDATAIGDPEADLVAVYNAAKA